MLVRRLVYAASFLVIGLLWNAVVGAQDSAPSGGETALAGRWLDLALPSDCETGFRRFIHMAQTGQLGADVTNANVSVFKNHARLELVREGVPNSVVTVTPKGSAQTTSRYFNVEPGEGATSSDVILVGKALDTAFDTDPFQLAYDFFNAMPGGAPIPSLSEAWSADGWRGVLRSLERRTVALASLPYTITVIVVLATTFLVSLVLLWGSVPPHSTAESLSDS